MPSADAEASWRVLKDLVPSRSTSKTETAQQLTLSGSGAQACSGIHSPERAGRTHACHLPVLVGACV